MNHRVEAVQYYQQALKAGRKSHRQDVQRGRYPFLQILDEILTDHMIAGEIDLGTMEIPTDKIVGTKSDDGSLRIQCNRCKAAIFSKPKGEREINIKLISKKAV